MNRGCLFCLAALSPRTAVGAENLIRPIGALFGICQLWRTPPVGGSMTGLQWNRRSSRGDTGRLMETEQREATRISPHTLSDSRHSRHTPHTPSTLPGHRVAGPSSASCHRRFSASSRITPARVLGRRACLRRPGRWRSSATARQRPARASLPGRRIVHHPRFEH